LIGRIYVSNAVSKRRFMLVIAPTTRPRRTAFSAVVFVAFVVGVPAFELLRGGSLAKAVGPESAGAFARGDWFRKLDAVAEEESYFAETGRPVYQETLYELFSATTPRVVLGRDGYLFLSETSLDYPGPDGEAKVAEIVELIGVVSAWFKARGTTLLCVPAPNKESIVPDSLPPRARVRPMAPALLDGLRKTGVAAVDLVEAFKGSERDVYLPNDSHWSDDGVLSAANAVATLAATLFQDGLPGDEVAFRTLRLEERDHFGDLQRMLGFRAGSAAERRFFAKRRPLRVEALDETSSSPFDERSPIVVCGTSFSHSFPFPEATAAALHRRVVDAAVAGRGPTVKLFELAERVRSGERPPPALIVWEFPEKHVFTRPAEFLLPMRAFAATARSEALYDLAAATPLPIKGVKLKNIAAAEEAAGRVKGFGAPPKAGAAPDPFVVYDVDPSPPADGAFALEVVVRTEKATHVKVFLDTGEGRFDEARASRGRTQGGGAPLRLLIPVGAPGAKGSLRRVRVDPASNDAPFEIEPPRVTPRSKPERR
jgi:hypothetical protein